MTKILSKIKTSLFPSNFKATKAPIDQKVVFHVMYDSLLVGKLSLEDGEWTFKYSDQFKSQSEINKLTEFPDLNKEYKSADLWPFFVVRIPSIQQPKVKKIISTEGIDDSDQVALLKRFGENTIVNPFTLVLG
tara:strand:- start:17233 stop:17631 length:399 start_codon:yes stop_codon:yes gene_type:complete